MSKPTPRPKKRTKAPVPPVPPVPEEVGPPTVEVGPVAPPQVGKYTRGIKSLKKLLQSGMTRKALSSPKGIAGLAGLGLLGGYAGKKLLQVPQDYSQIEQAISRAEANSKGQRVAQALERLRMEKSLAENMARLAQANPTLYTSVMAGRKVPTGAVVLGGQPRVDLMRELAASMDSGRYTQKDPLSDLMG